MDSLDYQYDYSFRQSPENAKCWKERLAWLFRRIADRLDRRESFALRFASDPGLTRQYRNHCVERGMSISFDLMVESVKYKSMDRHLQAQHPHLWQSPETNSEKS